MGRNKKRFTAVDLFSGAGGLTHGLKRAGFKVVAAVEADDTVAKTYRANHPDTKLIIKDIRVVSGGDILKACRRKAVDLIVGCPPCQGFTDLTTKYRRKDKRNNLVLEMARLVEEIEPKAIMLENVPGLRTRGKRILSKFVSRLEKKGYVINEGVLQIANYGVPQSRKRLVILAGKGFKIPFPAETHSNKKRRSRSLKPWVTLKEAIAGFETPISLSAAKKSGGPQRYNWHVVSDLKKITKIRLAALKPGANRASLPEKLRPNCHKEKESGFINVYGRLRWKEPAPTITSSFNKTCTGRFGHPKYLRALSVREAATIQTFPKYYEFKTDRIDRACYMVGNAFPPKLARKLGTSCINAIAVN